MGLATTIAPRVGSPSKYISNRRSSAVVARRPRGQHLTSFPAARDCQSLPQHCGSCSTRTSSINFTSLPVAARLIVLSSISSSGHRIPPFMNNNNTSPSSTLDDPLPRHCPKLLAQHDANRQRSELSNAVSNCPSTAPQRELHNLPFPRRNSTHREALKMRRPQPRRSRPAVSLSVSLGSLKINAAQDMVAASTTLLPDHPRFFVFLPARTTPSAPAQFHFPS
ncbi:hypothetical protein B0J17DRAFT_723781 [Rhizoctonia solani]|nr:hypothetical protein B0J17DRAFT_723781 [Rhizoctonia solani]